MTHSKKNTDGTLIDALICWSKPLSAALMLVWVAFAGATAAQAQQSCNASISQMLSFNTNLVVNDPVAPVLTLSLSNQNLSETVRFEHNEGGISVPLQFFPNCMAVQTSPPDLNSPTLCDPLDDGLGGLLRPISILPATLNASAGCFVGGVTSVVAVPLNSALGQDRVDFQFRDAGNNPIPLELPGGGTCEIVVTLGIDNVPDGFPGDTNVLFVAGTELTCVDSQLNNDALDSGGALFSNAICGAEVDKQVSCDAGATWNDVDANFPDGASDPEGATGCTGWQSPSPPEVRVRYRAANLSINNVLSGNDLTGCTLTDTNPLVPSTAGIGSLSGFFDDFIGFGAIGTELLECSEAFDGFEPNTATLDCICPQDSWFDPQIPEPISVSDSADIECKLPAIELTKECGNDGQQLPNGNFEYTVTVTNPDNLSGATLNNCVVTDPLATGCETNFGTLVPGASDSITCETASITNMATVTCEIEGAFEPDGQPKTISTEATAECACDVQLDKQISCDGGATWADAGPGGNPLYDDGVASSCVGWNDPTDPTVGEEIRLRYLARANSMVEDCFLVDSNGAIVIPDPGNPGAPTDPLVLPPGQGQMIFMTEVLQCIDVLPGEPDTAELVCTCAEVEGEASDTDSADLACQEPAVQLDKECTDTDGIAPFDYTLQVTNPVNADGATIANCVIDDDDSSCDGAVFDGPFAPGEGSAVIDCTSQNSSNTATVTCDILDESGEPVADKSVTDTDDAECEEVPPAVEVVKECASNNGDGTYTYNVKVTNTTAAGGASLENCMLDDPDGICAPLAPAGSLAPGEMATTTCTGDSNMNMVTVTCDIADSGQPPETVTDESMDGCVDVDKQISCDGGSTFVDIGYNDSFPESCIGWNTVDPNDPNDPGKEIVFRYRVRTGVAVSQCVLIDSNPAIPPAPPIGALPSKYDNFVYTTPAPPDALFCEEVEPGEPDTAILTCLSDESGVELTDSDDADLQCLEASVDVVKECASNNGDGTYTYDIKVTNSGTADLANCFLDDPMAVCGPLSQDSLAPNDMATAECTGDSDMNMVKVTCDIVGAFFPNGEPKMVMAEAMEGCVTVDKQVSCDGGISWNDEGYNDATAEGCIGWDNINDPNIPNEVVFRYLVKTGAPMTDCTIVDSNPAIPPAPPIGDLPAKFNQEVFRTPPLECNDGILEFEPNTATVVCTSSQSGREVTDRDDANLACEEPSVDVAKECTDNQDPQGDFIYTVTVTNDGTAALANCVLDDPTATCGPLSQTALPNGGDTATAECLSPELTNSVTVTCDIVGSGPPGGPPKKVMDEDDAECECEVELDKQVSCDGGSNWYDATGDDDPDGLGTLGCTGWTPGSGPPEVKVRYFARSNAQARCELSDNNTAILGGPVLIDIAAGGEEMIMTDLISCDESQAGWLEPNTATLSCECLDADGDVVSTPDPVEDTAEIVCQDVRLEVTKECADQQDPLGDFIYTVTASNPVNPDGASLENCVIDDLTATCGPLSQTSLAPGESATADCVSPELTNAVTVTCDIVGSFDPHTGGPKTVMDEDNAECVCEIDVDKQISCDGGVSWNDVTGADDPDGSGIEGCIGWTPGSGPPEVKVRYFARSNARARCELTDTNTAILPGTEVFTFDAGGGEQMFMTDLIECDENQAGWREPDTATLSCECLDESGDVVSEPDPVEDSADITCQTPRLDVTKECTNLQDAQGNYIYDVTISNPLLPDGATLQNCLVEDIGASCDGQFVAGPFVPGSSTVVECASPDVVNTASVTCEIVGAVDSEGEPKTITDEGSAECLVCELEVVKTCEVIQPPQGNFVCSDAKPLDVLVMIWNGTETIDVTAHKGDRDDPIVGQVLGVVPGQEVRISGFAGSPNDIIWEIFLAGTSTKLGESRFHMSCSDPEMNGPEDCSLPEGDGKGTNAGFINDWALEGLEGNGLALDCTQDPVPPSDTCAASNSPVECTRRPTLLSLRITGGNCATSMNTQGPDKWSCTDFLPIDPTQPVEIFAAKKIGDPPYLNLVQVNVGDVVDLDPTIVGRDDIDAEMTFQIYQGGLAQEVRVHTSCSQDLATGDKFGSFQIWSFENDLQGTVQFGVEVIYEYQVTNLSNAAAFDISVIDDPDPGDPFEVSGSPVAQLQPNETITLNSTQLLSETTSNVVTVLGAVGTPNGPTCDATDEAIVFFEGFIISKECAERDANGDNAVTITLRNVGDVDLVCDVEDPLANFVQNGVLLSAGATVTLDATVSGLTMEELNTATASCTEVQSGDVLPPRTASDLCEVPVEPRFSISKLCAAQDANGDSAIAITLINTGSVDLVCDVSDPLAGFTAFGVSVPQGGAPVVLNTSVSGLASNTVNTASADCTEQVGGTTLPTETATDLCEVAGDCNLEVEKTCLVVPPPPTGFNCSDAKPIDVVSMIWGGAGTVDIRAWKGNVGSTMLAELVGIVPGAEVSVSGFAGSPNDVYWEVFENGSNFGDKRGNSKFHLSCSDSEMNGPEDCGNNEGDGKGNDSGFINDWRFEGLEGSGLVLDCTPTPAVASGMCEAESNETLCTKRPAVLSLRLTGDDCSASSNTQGSDKWDCTDNFAIDPTQPVQIWAGKDAGKVYLNMVPADIGDVVDLVAAVIGRKDLESEATVQIYQGGLAQEVRFHTSCSQDLRTGDRFGGLQVWSYQNADQGLVQLGVEVEYEYKITNTGGIDVLAISVVDTPTPGEPFTVDGSPIGLLEPNDMVTLSSTQFLTETTANEVVVTGHGGTIGGPTCDASAMAAVVFVDPPPMQDNCDDGKPRLLVFEYTGESCNASDNDQGSSDECSGDPNGAQPVRIVVTKDENDVTVDPSAESITVGSLVIFEATGNRLKSNLVFDIKQGSSTVQDLKVHTSCSKPLNVGDVFGSMILRAFEAEQ